MTVNVFEYMSPLQEQVVGSGSRPAGLVGIIKLHQVFLS